jgi:hypothetical protein
VPTLAPRLRGRVGEVGSNASGRTSSTSRGSSRSDTAASSSPAIRTLGRSLCECTAMSARPSATASCTALVKIPAPASA